MIIKTLRLLTLFILIPCGASSQGIFIDSSDPFQPVISVMAPAEHGQKIANKISSGAIKKEFALYLIKEGKRMPVPVGCKYNHDVDRLTMTPAGKLGYGQNFEILRILAGDTTIENYVTPALLEGDAPLPEITEIYPQSTEIPKNILYFHIRFSEPMMSDIGAYHQIQLLDPNGESIDLIWRHKSFWLDNNRLLVLMIHPGRVKREINLEKPFEVGKKYKLVAKGELKDQYGRTVSFDESKEFTIAEGDYEIPKALKEKFVVPYAGTTEPLQFGFSDKMDQASIVDGIEIRNSQGQVVAGEILTSSDDMDFLFDPKEEWKSGIYELVMKKVVSDLSANRLNRPFELKDPEDVKKDKDIIWKFEIK